MDHPPGGTKTNLLWTLILLGIAYSSLARYLSALTEGTPACGAVGVVLGLYICSHPAAFAVDLLFFRRWAGGRFFSKKLDLVRMVLNMLSLLVGWLVIFIGTTQLVGRAGR
jgi:hypothetical protein